MSTPTRKICLYSIRLVDTSTPESYFPISGLSNLVGRIAALPKNKRVQDLSRDKKFHCLRDLHHFPSFTGLVFRSAKYAHRPPLINKKAEERDSPKSLIEGEAEATHLGLVFCADEAIAVLEERRSGMTMKRICEYLGSFLHDFCHKDKVPVPFLIEHGIIPKGGFEEELKKLKRATVGELYVEKQLLGDVGISNRTSEARNELSIVVKAEKKKDLKEIALDAFDRLTGQKCGVKRIRIYGTSENNEQTILDTDTMKTIHWLNVDLHEETGEVNTASIFKHFGKICSALKP
jgi:hypothetical protein